MSLPNLSSFVAKKWGKGFQFSSIVGRIYWLRFEELQLSQFTVGWH
jgi:hypothetical protein